MNWIVAAALALIAGFALASGGSRGDPERAPYLEISTAYATYRTFDVIDLEVRAATWSNRTGNLTLEPYTAWLNLTVYDEIHDVIILQRDILLWLGNASYSLRVEPIWTETILLISVRDFANGLGDSIRIRTEMSTGYMFSLWESRRLEDRAALHALYEGKFWTVTVWESSAFATLTMLMAIVFLRVDYRRSVLAGVESYWERFVSRVWPFATIPTDTLWLDEENTYDPEAARFWRWSRQYGQWRRWKDLRDEVDEAFRSLTPPPPEAAE